MALISIAAMACSVPAPGPCETADDPHACFDSRYLGGYDPPVVARCTEQGEAYQIGESVPVALFYGPGLTESDVMDQSLRLQRYYSAYDLDFEASAAAEPMTLAYAISGSGAQIEQALHDAGIALDRVPTDDESRRAHQIVGEVIFAELRAFAAEQSNADRRALNLLLVQRIMEPQLSEYLYGSTESGLLGFGLSSTMLGRIDPDDPGRDLYEITGLPEWFTPMIIIGHYDIAGLAQEGDNVIAHEAGHALGLVHSTDPDNLMYPSSPADCDANLSREQLAEVSELLADSEP